MELCHLCWPQLHSDSPAFTMLEDYGTPCPTACSLSEHLSLESTTLSTENRKGRESVVPSVCHSSSDFSRMSCIARPRMSWWHCNLVPNIRLCEISFGVKRVCLGSIPGTSMVSMVLECLSP